MNGDESIQAEEPIFDHLAEKFFKNIYGSWKGRLRLQVIWEDLIGVLSDEIREGRCNVLDIGGGHAPIARRLAKYNNPVVVCDPSKAMLSRLRLELEADGLRHLFTVFQQPIEALEAPLPFLIQLVQLHAVLEWSKDPLSVLTASVRHLAPSGWLSLLFFNEDALRFKQAQIGYFKHLKSTILRRKDSLQPIYPLPPHVVYRWLDQLDLVIDRITPIRAIVDYLMPNVKAKLSADDYIALELRYKNEPIAVHTARYLHVLARRLP